MIAQAALLFACGNPADGTQWSVVSLDRAGYTPSILHTNGVVTVFMYVTTPQRAVHAVSTSASSLRSGVLAFSGQAVVVDTANVQPFKGANVPVASVGGAAACALVNADGLYVVRAADAAATSFLTPEQVHATTSGNSEARLMSLVADVGGAQAALFFTDLLTIKVCLWDGTSSWAAPVTLWDRPVSPASVQQFAMAMMPFGRLGGMMYRDDHRVQFLSFDNDADLSTLNVVDGRSTLAVGRHPSMRLLPSLTSVGVLYEEAISRKVRVAQLSLDAIWGSPTFTPTTSTTTASGGSNTKTASTDPSSPTATGPFASSASSASATSGGGGGDEEEEGGDGSAEPQLSTSVVVAIVLASVLCVVAFFIVLYVVSVWKRSKRRASTIHGLPMRGAGSSSPTSGQHRHSRRRSRLSNMYAEWPTTRRASSQPNHHYVVAPPQHAYVRAPAFVARDTEYQATTHFGAYGQLEIVAGNYLPAQVRDDRYSPLDFARR